MLQKGTISGISEMSQENVSPDRVRYKRAIIIWNHYDFLKMILETIWILQQFEK